MKLNTHTELDQLLENAPLPFIVQHASRISSVKQRVSSMNLVLKSIQRRIDNIDHMLSANNIQGSTSSSHTISIHIYVVILHLTMVAHTDKTASDTTWWLSASVWVCNCGSLCFAHIFKRRSFWAVRLLTGFYLIWGGSFIGLWSNLFFFSL